MGDRDGQDGEHLGELSLHPDADRRIKNVRGNAPGGRHRTMTKSFWTDLEGCGADETDELIQHSS